MSSSHRALVVGLTGGIGSGKTTVARMLAELGATVIDGDAIGHELLEVPEIKDKLVTRWGQELLDEEASINRSRLARRAFADAQSIKDLNTIMHPMLLTRLNERLEQASAGGHSPMLVVDAALLVEWGLEEICHKLVFVEAPLEVRQARIQDARGWDGQELARRESFQLPLSLKKKQADYVIDNSAGLTETRKQVQELWRRVRSRSVSQKQL